MNTSLLPAPPPSGSGTQTHFLYSDSESILGLGKSASLGGQPHYKTCLYLGTVQMQMSKAGQMQESGTRGERPPAMQKALKGPWRPRSCFSVNRPHPRGPGCPAPECCLPLPSTCLLSSLLRAHLSRNRKPPSSLQCYLISSQSRKP